MLRTGRGKHDRSHAAWIDWRTGLKRLLTGLLATVLLLAGPGGAQFAVAQVQQQTTAAAVAELRAAFTDVRAQLDRSAFDVDALSLDLAFADAEEIVDLLHQRIAFEQYAGILRGPQGTLIAGAGNAWDQSLLLANLLGSAGYDVRIARGQLDEEQAGQLLMQLGQGPAPADDVAQLVEQLPVQFDEEVLAEAAEQVAAEANRLLQDTADMTSFIQQELAGAGVRLPGTDTSELLEEARDYAWVEYRLGAADNWQSAHVAFAAPPESLADLEASEYLDDSIPEELQHRFRFEVFIEQRLGDELEVRPVTSAWERPVANMTGVPLTYQNAPDGADAGLTVGEMIENSQFFVPLFNGSVANGAQSFDILGNSAASDVTGSAAAGLFQSIGGLFGQAAGGLAGEDDPSEFVTLSAQWLEFTFITPGGTETTYRRTVMDRIGAENRAAGLVEMSGEVSVEEAQLALTRTHNFMVSSGSFSEAYLLDGQVQATLSMLDYAEAAAAVADSGDALPPELSSDDEDALKRLDHLNLYATVDGLQLAEGEVSYRHVPGLIVFENGAATEFARVDVVSNARRTFTTEAGSLPVPAPQLALRAGVWETRVEGLPLTSRGRATLNTFTTFEAAGAEQIEVVTLTPADTAAVSQLQLPLESLNAISDDLAHGYVVIAPTAVPQGSDHPAWWRVHADTGETLGRGLDGRGAEMLEYQMQLEASLARAGLILSGASTLAGCSATSSNAFQFSCCVWEGLLITMGSASLGLALGGLFAGSAIVLFIGLDVVGNAALLTGSLMDVIPSTCSSLGGGTCLLPLL